jgi:hypothetical protein
MSIEYKKFKKLFRELQYHQSELDYVLEILKTAHWDFEEYYRGYCKEKEIDISGLDKKHQSKVDKLIPKSCMQEHDPCGTYKPKAKEFIDNTDLKQFKKIYREIAKILHPDKGGDEKEFKKISDALAEKNWSVLLEMCEEYKIPIKEYDETNKLLKKKIEEIKEKTNKEKSTYSWLLYECEDRETCRKNVVKKFLKHLFNYA